MIPIFGNKPAFAMLVVGGLIAGLGKYVLHLPELAVMLMIGAVTIATDLTLRWRARSEPGWLVHRQYGGQLYIVPMWGIGIVAILGGLRTALER
jgi:hypothetical protein